MDFCALDCTYVSFSDSSVVDGPRSCRTFNALYCSKKRSLVHKSLPCTETESAAAKDRRRSPGK